MLKAFKVRIYPNKTQAAYIAKAIGCTRAIYNMMLHDEKAAFEQFKAAEEHMTEEEKKTHKYKSSMSYSVYTKQESTAYLKEIEARALNYAQQNLKKAFTNFFKGWRKGVGYPAYKHKTTEGSFQSDDIQVIGRKLKVPKCPGLIPFRNYAEIDFSTLKTKTITISRTSNFKYYASILCENAADVTLPKTGVTIGIDLGVTTAITLSDGRKIDRQSIQTQKMYFQGNRNGEDPRVAKLREKISFFQKKLAKAGEWTEKTFTGKDGKQHTKRVLVQETGNYRRYKAKVAALTEKLYNMRSNYINNTAKYVVKEADVICMEDLIIQNGCEHHGMLADDAAKTTHQNRTSHRNIAEASMGMLATKIKSMAIMYGKTVIEVNPAYTSRTCHCCGHLLTEPLATTIRDWTCPKCHTHHDRDVNAAKNILQKGLDKMNKNC